MIFFFRGCDGERVYFNGCSSITLNGNIMGRTAQYGIEEVLIWKFEKIWKNLKKFEKNWKKFFLIFKRIGFFLKNEPKFLC